MSVRDSRVDRGRTRSVVDTMSVAKEAMWLPSTAMLGIRPRDACQSDRSCGRKSPIGRIYLSSISNTHHVGRNAWITNVHVSAFQKQIALVVTSEI